MCREAWLYYSGTYLLTLGLPYVSYTLSSLVKESFLPNFLELWQMIEPHCTQQACPIMTTVYGVPLLSVVLLLKENIYLFST